MLRINRLVVEINTANGTYGIDAGFHNGLTFVASSDNTCGKSSVLAAIYYCLGFEQIIGGVSNTGEKVLTSAFKKSIEDEGTEHKVTTSGAYLEIFNGNDTITIYRSAVSDSRQHNLVSVYYGKYDVIGNPQTQKQDMYVHAPNSAIGQKGFHTFLAEFLHLDLPDVRTTNDGESKLYLQIIFSSMFIEQKQGWAGILSGMPYLGVRDAKKRIIEFILNLDTLKNEKERDRLSSVESAIKKDWNDLVKELQRQVTMRSCVIENIYNSPRVLNESDTSRISAHLANGNSITDEVTTLETEYNNLRKLTPKVVDNFEALNQELEETESVIVDFEDKLREINRTIATTEFKLGMLKKDLEIVNADIRNNNDAARLQRFGADSTTDTSSNICPVCNQEIHDNLLFTGTENLFMDIDSNIKHLKAQKDMLEFSRNSENSNLTDLKANKSDLESRLVSLRRLAYTLRSDLFTSTNTDASEAIALQRVQLKQKIDTLNELEAILTAAKEAFKLLSERWNTYLSDKNKLPKKGLSDSDNEKLNYLKIKFIENLKRYHYSSTSNFAGIQIADETFLPIIDGFDMKFDSSASDGIRVIWAFTMALLQVSIAKKGNHPGVLIFDEPAQQSIVPEDMSSFITSVMEISGDCQVVVAITLNSGELNQIIHSLKADSFSTLNIEGKAFKRFEANHSNDK